MQPTELSNFNLTHDSKKEADDQLENGKSDLNYLELSEGSDTNQINIITLYE